MSICCIRGAITVEENTRENILYNSKLLLNEIIKKNNININSINSVFFTATKDITKVYPAVAAREIGICEAGLMCVQEMFVEGSLEMCIRVLITANIAIRQKDVKHVYMKNAKKLRPDLSDKKNICVAIDGPAGSGKSTIARIIAKELNFIYVDTGAMYRSVALYCINNNISTNDNKKIINILDNIDIKIDYINDIQNIFLNEENVTELIRNQIVADGASKVAAIKEVREKLVDIQRKIALNKDVIMDGRDIGTHVLPNAHVKIYLDASIDERTKRRCNELKENGIAFKEDEIKKEIVKRDNYDKNRKESPLKQAEDAIFIDTSSMKIEDVKNEIIKIIKRV